ncbi:sensor domain-containing diguanylate cyclase [Luteimonas cellulosilyticus]|uniref:sensor domain-containing diguanylate cyclase n=1 Tax=Luteimonas cellulosilyticus TaxID=2683586 RepID=UPI00135778C8|nr:diguanylate cyclase [Luteimonas cellulosilyticus]
MCPLSNSSSRFKSYRLPAFALALLLLIGTGAASVVGVENLRASNAWIEHTYRVLNRIEVVDQLVRSSEASGRAYRLTGHPEFRQQYLRVVPGVEREVGALVALTADNPVQAPRARVLQALVRTHMAELQRLHDIQEMFDMEAARTATDATRALTQWRRIEDVSAQMREEETRLLTEREARSQRAAVWLTVLVVLGTLVSAGLMIWLMWNVTHENRRAQTLEREARDAFHEMALSMAKADRLSQQRHQLSRYSGLLQSCETRDEIVRLTGDTLAGLIPGVSGQCYLLRASQNFYESIATFGDATISSADMLLPNQCWALRRGQPHHLPAGAGGMRCDHLDAEAPLPATSSLCLPLVAQGAAIGLLHISAPADGMIDDGDTAIVGQIAEQLGLAIVNLQLRETLRTQSLRDPLTGLFNRRYLEENLSRELQRCERRGLPLSVLMLDVDHFKRFNDSHGHAAGDALLSQVGRLIQSRVRSEDIACRYGGEEFTVVMPEMDAEGACQRADEIRTAIETATVLHLRQTLGPVTISIGIATYPHDGATAELLQQMADATLYRAKAEGRNRVLHASHRS